MAEKENGRQSKIVTILEVFGNIFFLNILFIITSLPIVTIGASLTALYSVNMKMVRKEEGTISQSFFDAFKKNFKKATIAWLLVLLAIAVLYSQLSYVAVAKDVTGTIYFFIMVFEFVLFFVTVQFLFPLIARYDNTLFNTIKNSFLLAVSNLWAWAKFTLIWFMPVFLAARYFILFFYTWYLWLIFGFGLIAYCNSIVVRKVFEKVESVQSENKEKASAKKAGKTSIEEQRKKLVREKMKRFENKADDDE